MALLGVLTKLVENATSTNPLSERDLEGLLDILNRYLKAAADLKKDPTAAIYLPLPPNMSELIKEELKEWSEATDNERWLAYQTFIDSFIPESRVAAIFAWLSNGYNLPIDKLLELLNFNNGQYQGQPFAYKMLAIWLTLPENAADAAKIIAPLIQSLEEGKPTVYDDSSEIRSLQAIPQTDQEKAVVIACWWLSQSDNNTTKIPLEKIHPLIKNVHIPPLTDNTDLASSILAKWLQSLDESARSIQTILYKFDKLGMINDNDMALVLAAKTSKKMNTAPNYENSIFIIKEKEIDLLIEQVKFLLTNNTDDVIKFQIIFYRNIHTIFGEFEINKTKNPPTIKYLHCEPVESTSGSFTKVDSIITTKFKTEILPLVESLEIYNSSISLQKGLGCTYFALDGTSMLATPAERPYAQNVMQYMRDHKDAKKEQISEKITVISAPLPPRFVRGSHFKENIISLVDSPEADKLVNKKNQTAKESIREHMDLNQEKSHNMRIHHKMKTYHQKVKQYVQNKKFSSSEISEIGAPYKIGGLQQFCKNKTKAQEKLLTSNYQMQKQQPTNNPVAQPPNNPLKSNM